ncbi:receptor-type tyrosine-protein phosphatase H-like isoform X2 [Anarhichas minor]|uniref:receptor-type tyrosine-protein phosphatase H-like isoform X2 n=1 Tax=Anarhichas minor TaxID=65739 RepID=UPI003F7384F4
MEPLSFKTTSDRFLLCVFLSLLWVVTDSNATTSVPTPKMTTPLTTLPTTKPQDFKSVGQNETSITLQWERVKDILNYTLLFSGGEINVTASVGQEPVTHTITGLTNMTQYDFTLFTVFENIKSSGVNISAFTAPPDAEGFKSVEQNETSITLQWNKVKDILNYTLLFSEGEINVTASVGLELVTHTITGLTNMTQYDFTLFTLFENIKSSGVNISAFTAPPDAEDFKSVAQNETSITLQWKRVKDILDYTLLFSGGEINVTASVGQEPVTHTILELTSGTIYSFTLFTVFENINSRGVNTSAITAPPDAEDFKSVAQNETSITLQWERVKDILNYTLLFSGGEINVTASVGLEPVSHTITGLTNMTQYDFTLFTLFENVKSSGVNITAFTAPPNAEDFKSFGQSETSITLQWERVKDILDYTLLFSGGEINVTASVGQELVTHTILELTSGTIYSFTLFTVFENIKSRGVNTSAITAPLNAEGFKSVGQNETSITLQWERVKDMLDYTLLFSGGEINVTASVGQELVRHTILDLTSGTIYSFTLFTVFENINSSGVKHDAPTAPGNVNNVTALTQNESSITLKWDKVNNISSYVLQYDNREDAISIPHQNTSVTYEVYSLNAGTKYDFTLITRFEKVNSTGFSFDAVTAPLNAEGFKSVAQNETSITLQWERVKDILNYELRFSGREINVTASARQELVRHTILELTSGTIYSFTLFTVFEKVRSSGVKHDAPTAPGNVNNVTALTQNESSITLKWDTVNNISSYVLQYDNREDAISIPHQNASVKYEVYSLNAGTKYDFTLITRFEKVNSTGFSFHAVTAPLHAEGFKSVAQNETSITLQWERVNDILDYELRFSEGEINVTASARQELVRHTILELTSGTIYSFTLFTVFEKVRSSGVKHDAPTAPGNVNNVTALTQNESSITLKWDTVNNISSYVLQYDNREDAISIPHQNTSVKYEVYSLNAGTKYDFTLITRFEKVNSTGFSFDAVTAPLHAEGFKSVAQNETSITLQWERVNDILDYELRFSEGEINVTASARQELVRHTILELTSGTIYSFTLFTVFEKVRSSGVKHDAPTAPGNVNNVTALTQNESSITLKWDTVNNISSYVLQYDNREDAISIPHQNTSVKYEVYSLNAGTKYDFTLITRFEKVNSTGFSFDAVTVPLMVISVDKTERSVTSVTLTWPRVNTNWYYFLQIIGEISRIQPKGDMDVVSHTITSLQPGTLYPFSLKTEFSGLNSTAYEDYTLTTIDCPKGTWRVTNSSIQGTIEGVFSNATATNKTQTHVSPGGGNVSFAGLYPGATYEVSLFYERNSETWPQLNHTVTILPAYLSAECEYWAAGYSVSIVWNNPEGVWTSVEVNVSGETHPVPGNDKHLRISGFQPAKTYEVSLALLSGTVKSHEPFVFSCLTDPRGVIAGAVFAVVIFCLLLCLAFFIFFKRPDIIGKKSFIGGSRQPNKKCKAISVAKFPDHFYQLGVDENRGFSQEYESLLPVGTEQMQDVSLLPQNKARNRFNNVLPYDWSRVKLTTSNPNESSDYINACYMPGYKSDREYIATQGPLPSTVNDFWRMIWEQRVNGIVMVTNCTEGGRTKCERYWPADTKPCSFGQLLVTIRSEQQEPNWTLREFRVKHGNTSEERTVRHFHFTAWPDHGVPQGTEVLIQFRELVRQHIDREERAPTVVHCSAGVGRTGTIIALDVLLQQLEKESAVGINGFVHKMRLSRPHMVQTESQYVFLHQCMMDRLQPDEKTEENIYENVDMIYANATALREFTKA